MRTVRWEETGPAVIMIDQRLLPGDLVELRLETPLDVTEAIRSMAVRGAPAIGISGAFGLALAAARSTAKSTPRLIEELNEQAKHLLEARPTAVNLGWAMERVLQNARDASRGDMEAVRSATIETAKQLAEDDVRINRQIADQGASLIADGDTLIHHCNTGALAAVDYGTALGVIRRAHEMGKRIHVLVDETRPRLQGARLTAWECEQYGIPYEIITDSAAGYFIQQGLVRACFVGADRVARNGDVANKIGTYMLALAAQDHDVPLYCALPCSTFDLSIPDGSAIPIEERSPQEVLGLQQDGKPIAPASARARNPAFDITPNRFITAFITEAGILRPPYDVSIPAAVQGAGAA
ncbi:MAG: S-methyl-5-thioribose-1-phosphate isomerase [Anaerolineales bacterium]